MSEFPLTALYDRGGGPLKDGFLFKLGIRDPISIKHGINMYERT